MSRRNELERLLSHTLERTDLSIGPKYEGKVRDTYALSGQRRLLVVTDRISAFDRVLEQSPRKGRSSIVSHIGGLRKPKVSYPIM